ncbi:MAG: branched-chain amino acid ABC transporter substrate-binding protein [Candidatus Electrothrix sp. GW3-4]|uniref:branched-chain amino acid ABC transporter substrate-binding protein n=1 Tax=Candidatus Electrothrix sp. GW3-4 TaxID=3126740 RepID=UPI0030D5B41B
MNISRKLCSVLSVLTLSTGSLFLQNALAEEPVKEPIKIGVAGALSGDLASYGLPTARAAELVAGKINAEGGLNGAPVELLVEDDVCKPEIATNTATKLVSAGAQVVIGHICSSATKAAMPIYDEANVIVMSPSATDSDLTKSGNYPTFYRTIAPNDAQAYSIVNFAVGQLQAQKIAIIHDKGDYGKGLAEDARRIIEQDAKAKIVLFEGITPGAVDYSAVVQKVKRTRADVVIYGGYHPEASKIVTQMRRKRMKTLFISDDGVKDDTFIKVAGKYAEGVYATGPADVSANPITRQYREAYMKKYGVEPGPFFDNAIAAALALTNSIRVAGSTEMEQIAKTLHSQATATPFGEIMFDKNGDAIGVGYSLYEVKKGAFVQVQ